MRRMVVWMGLMAGSIACLAAGDLELVSGEYRLLLGRERAYAIRRLAFGDWEVIQDKGANGLVLAEEHARYLGCDGNERLVDLEILADDRRIPPEAGTVSGQRIKVVRNSRIRNLLVTTTWRLSPQGLEWRTAFRTEGRPQAVDSLYLYALSFNPATAEFRGRAVSGAVVEGAFAGRGGWQVNTDLHHLVLHDPGRGRGALIYFPEVIEAAGRRATVWDLEAYHKFYLQLPVGRLLPPGHRSREYVVRLQCFAAGRENWRSAAGPLVRELDKECRKAERAAVRQVNPVPIPDFGDTSGDDWATNRRGIQALDPDYVLPPFPPLQADGSGARVWFRRYLLAPTGLLRQAVVGGEELLAAPQWLNLAVDGRKADLRPVSQKLALDRKGRSVHDSRLQAGDLDMRTLTTIEYDGMVRIDLTLTPRRPLVVDHLDYGFSLPRRRARLMHFIGAPRVSNLSIMVPRESFTFKVPEKEGVFFSEGFKTLVWLGDTEKGFLWFCGSEQHFSPQDIDRRPAALTAAVRRDTVAFTVTPVGEPYRIDKPITYTFGFFGTPVRPEAPGWREWAFTTRLAMYGSEMQHGQVGTMPMIWPDEFRAMDALPRIQPRDEARIRGYIDALHRAGRPALTYVDPIRVGIGYLRHLDYRPTGDQLNDLFLDETGRGLDAFGYLVPEVAANFNRWKTQPEVIYGYGAARGGRELRVSGPGWTDFLCFLAERMALLGFDGFGDIDNCFPIRDQNPLHGAGYVDQHGNRHWTWDWFARRDLMKRLCATLLKARNGRPGILVAHASATWSIPFLSFCDANLVFEHSNSGYFAAASFQSPYCRDGDRILEDVRRNGGRNYLRWAFPRERWQGELHWRQFGIPVALMANYTKSPHIDGDFAASVKAAREILMQAASHDCIYWPIWCNTRPFVDWTGIRRDFGIGAQDVESFPYWNPDSPVRTSTPDVLPTVYRRGHECLALVANWNSEDTTADLVFPGAGDDLRIVDAEDRNRLVPEKGRLPLPVKGRDYRILRISQRRQGGEPR